MTEKQLKQILTTIQVNYRNHFAKMEMGELQVMYQTWKHFFINWPYETVFKALMEYIATVKDHPPKPASINEILYSYINTDLVTADESFAKIITCANRYGYGNADLSKFNLSAIESKIVTRGYLKQIGLSTSELSYIKHDYVQSYMRIKENEIHKQMVALPTLDTKKIELLLSKKQFMLEG